MAPEACTRQCASRLPLLVTQCRELRLQPVDLLLQVVDEPERGGIERALVVREWLDVPPHQLAQHRFDGSAEPAAHAWAETQRAVGRDRPETLRLVTRGAPV